MDLLFLSFLDNIDSQLLLWVNSLHSPSADAFFYTVTKKWLWMPLALVVAAIVMHVGGWRRGVLCILSVALAVTFADQVCATWLRPAIERMRPSNLNNPLSDYVHVVNGYRGGRFGFPSCHASTTIAIATTLALFFRRKWVTIALYGWVALMCYSRMYLGVHYPGDIIGGFAVGLTGAFLSHWLYLRACALPPFEVCLRSLMRKLSPS